MPEEAIRWYTDVRATIVDFQRPEPAHLAQNLNYNLPGEKFNGGILVVDSLLALKGRTLTGDESRHSWLCVELVG